MQLVKTFSYTFCTTIAVQKYVELNKKIKILK